MDYKIICAQVRYQSNATEELTEKVKKCIEKGWKPQGGVSIATTSIANTTYYIVCQAMIKE